MTVEHEASVWRDALGLAYEFTEARGRGRKVLQYVLVKGRHGRLVTVGCDGFSLVEVTTAIAVPEDFGERLYARDDVSRAVKATKYPRSAGPVTCRLAEGDTHALEVLPTEGTGQRVTLGLTDEYRYSNYEALIPVSEGATGRTAVALGAHMLSRLAKACARADTSSARLYTGRDVNQPVRATFEAEGRWSAVAVVMPQVVKWEGTE